MVARLVQCACGVEKIHNKPCHSCHDMTDSEAWLLLTRERFALGEIGLDELEHEVERALTSPPRRRRDPTKLSRY